MRETCEIFSGSLCRPRKYQSIFSRKSDPNVLVEDRQSRTGSNCGRSFCIQRRLILYHHFRKKKDNLEKLTEIFEKNFRIRSVPFDFEKNFRKFWLNGTRPKFPQNGTKSDNLQTSGTTSDFPQSFLSLENV